MAYGVKYRIEYKDSANVDKKIDIEELDYTGAITDVDASADPLQIEIPAVAVHDPVVAAGCTVNMISATNMMFSGLYSIDPQKIRVRIYAGSSTVPYFVGYGNVEVHNEGYSRLQDYEVTHYFNDGFAVLERFKYLDGAGVKYTTLETMWNVLTRILTKMGLPFEYLYFACRHTCNGVSVGNSETLWHNLKIDQLNYYDEQDEPKTFREVLEALLQPFGLQIRWLDGSLIVCEPQMLADASFSAKRFDSSFAYVDTVSLAFNYDISNDEINWDNEDQGHDIKSGYSRQRIRYSPYVQPGAIPNIDVADRSLWTGTESWLPGQYGILRLNHTMIAIQGITLESLNVGLCGHKEAADQKEDIYFEGTEWNMNDLWLSVNGYHVAVAPDTFLVVSGEVYIRTKENEFGEEVSVTAGFIRVPITIEIGGYRYDWYGGVSTWVYQSATVPVGAYIYKDPDSVTICDKWVPFTAWIPNTDMPAGVAVLKVWDPIVSRFFNETPLDHSDGMISARMRNFNVKCYKKTGSTAKDLIELKNEDPEYIGQLDEEFISEAPEITLLHADAVSMTDRAGICKLDGSFTSSWRKTGDAVSYRLVDLLLRAIHSQYQDSLNQLTGTIEADELMQGNGGPGFLFTLQDTDNLSTRKLLFTGGTYNDFYRTLNGSFLEIRQEDLTIVIK